MKLKGMKRLAQTSRTLYASNSSLVLIRRTVCNRVKYLCIGPKPKHYPPCCSSYMLTPLEDAKSSYSSSYLFKMNTDTQPITEHETGRPAHSTVDFQVWHLFGTLNIVISTGFRQIIILLYSFERSCLLSS